MSRLRELCPEAHDTAIVRRGGAVDEGVVAMAFGDTILALGGDHVESTSEGFRKGTTVRLLRRQLRRAVATTCGGRLTSVRFETRRSWEFVVEDPSDCQWGGQRALDASTDSVRIRGILLSELID
jgi:hypothetical protein